MPVDSDAQCGVSGSNALTPQPLIVWQLSLSFSHAAGSKSSGARVSCMINGIHIKSADVWRSIRSLLRAHLIVGRVGWVLKADSFTVRAMKRGGGATAHPLTSLASTETSPLDDDHYCDDVQAGSSECALNQDCQALALRRLSEGGAPQSLDPGSQIPIGVLSRAVRTRARSSRSATNAAHYFVFHYHHHHHLCCHIVNMSLSMLVGGAECGPANPLQGLSKQFDRDRGLQQDHFGSARAGSSKEVFRSPYHTSPGTDRDAAQFFSSGQSSSSAAPAPSAYDLSALHTSLPAFQHVQMPVQSPPVMGPAPAAWAADFMQHQSVQGPVMKSDNVDQHQGGSQVLQPMLRDLPQVTPQWMPSYGFANSMTAVPYQTYTPPQPQQISQTLMVQSQWDEAFMSQEALTNIEHAMDAQEAQKPRVEDPDELARAAGKVIDAVRHEQNPKFKNSQFLGLMQQLRDREVIVEGDKMIPKEEATGWAADFQSSVDVKGKGKAVDSAPLAGSFLGPSTLQAAPSSQSLQQDNASKTSQLDSVANEVDAYFRQENEDYIEYWHGSDSLQQPQLKVGSSVQGTGQSAEWDQLQRDWDSFEATVTGLKAVSNYQFQENNPYVLGEASKTRHHAMHEGLSAMYESQSVLELEATVQRDPHNASAWFELGVKQQENEREQKAIHALRRALELDPTYLPAWLALAVSHTNDGNRVGAYEGIREWVTRNNQYATAVEAYRTSHAIDGDATQTEKFNNLIDCLITMARSDASGQIDADIQIALAILMNTNEVSFSAFETFSLPLTLCATNSQAYDKATDCFRTALAVRPDDWQLYNRVGATLANSGQPEEALQYYYRALELNPAYIRARFNLGISCINLRRYQEASQHILDALVLQDSDSVTEPDGTQHKRGVVSSALWDSLKTCCLHMQRLDLATICDRQDLDAFRFNYQIE
ncbi:hypothetical protein NM688_g6677 [Phlebia brevispora]|uniref:Uncharacterized protein n=1 Tax=Phlebia brevispora TaxID=194682 RepID=A0ACC1SDR9_9APHY|nr:hypothetical protein NM688_g6677 [Phlebia brevispora]